MALGGARPTGCSAVSTRRHAAISSAPLPPCSIVYDRVMLKGLGSLLGPSCAPWDMVMKWRSSTRIFLLPRASFARLERRR
jgi:hypothetical protein